MISFSRASNVNENEVFQTPSKKRSKKGEKEKKSKKQKARKETVENVDTSDEEKEDVMKEIPESPIFIPSNWWSSV